MRRTVHFLSRRIYPHMRRAKCISRRVLRYGDKYRQKHSKSYGATRCAWSYEDTIVIFMTDNGTAFGGVAAMMVVCVVEELSV